MSILHFVFSNSLAQCVRRKNQLIGAWGRQLLLVIHNCLINGLANIYVHNNLEIFVVYPKEKMRKRSLGYEEASYKPPNERRQTLIRQLIVDFIILIENLTMIVLAKNTVTSTSSFTENFPFCVIVIGICYFSAMFLKFTFYWCCHPWSTLIKPSGWRNSNSEASIMNVPTYSTNFVILSRNIEVQYARNSHTFNVSVNNQNDVTYADA